MNTEKTLVMFNDEIQNNNNSNDLKDGMQFSNHVCVYVYFF